jgi:hypothetical protein
MFEALKSLASANNAPDWCPNNLQSRAYSLIVSGMIYLGHQCKMWQQFGARKSKE